MSVCSQPLPSCMTLGDKFFCFSLVISKLSIYHIHVQDECEQRLEAVMPNVGVTALQQQRATRELLGSSLFEILISPCYSQWQRSLKKPGPVSHKCLSQKCYSRELRSICCFHMRAVNLECIHKCLPYNPIFGKLELFRSIESIIFFQLQTFSCSRTTVCLAPSRSRMYSERMLGLDGISHFNTLFIQATISQLFCLLQGNTTC